jgi:osmotically inducible protein OsmC
VGGRSGHVRSATGVVDLEMSVPEGLGGKKGATNPEELFAAGYSSCFQQALLVIAQRAGDKLDPGTEVKCSVTLFQEGEGYGLSAVLPVFGGYPRQHGSRAQSARRNHSLGPGGKRRRC